METKIIEENLPVLTCKLEQGNSIYTEDAKRLSMTPGVKMQTNINGGSIFKGVGRVLSGEPLFINTYKGEEDAEISFCSNYSSKILEFDLNEGEEIICQNNCFFCAEETIEAKPYFRKKMDRVFGIINDTNMKRITGVGKVFLNIGTNVVKKELSEGEVIEVDNNSLVAMTNGVEIDKKLVKGFKNVVFGENGLYLTAIKGPGTVWIDKCTV